MRAYKQFTTKDVTKSGFDVSRVFTFTGNQSTGSDVGIEYYLGECPPSNLIFVSQSANWSGINYKEPNIGVYSNIKQLYYTNFISSSYGDLAATQSIIPGANEVSIDFNGKITAPRYENFLQSSLTQSRFFPTGSGEKISVVSIPARMYGEKIVPDSFTFSYTSSTGAKYGVTDDGQGNLTTGSTVIGQIFYPHGIVVFTSGGFMSMSEDITDNTPPTYPNLDKVTLSYSSSFLINEFQYRCVIDENEFSYTLNPSALAQLNTISTQPNILIDSITTNTADAANTVITGVSASAVSASGDPSPGNGLIMTLTTLGVDGLSSVQGIQVTDRGHNYRVGDVLTIDKDQIPGSTTDVVITLTEDDFWITNKNGEIYNDYVTGSYFTPFLTTVGLYNNAQELLVVGKLSTPTPISKFVDTNVYVNFDM